MYLKCFVSLACVGVGWLDRTLGVCGDTFEEVVIRAFCGGEHNPILGSGCLGCVFGPNPTEYLLWVHFVDCLVKELVAIYVMGLFSKLLRWIHFWDDDTHFGK
jgi:hypothetical protein